MKRAGMHWSRVQVNPLLALTLLERNGRWGSEGPALLATHQAAGVRRRRERQQSRRRAKHPPPLVPAPPSPAPPPFRHPWRRYGAPLSAKKLTYTRFAGLLEGEQESAREVRRRSQESSWDMFWKKARTNCSVDGDEDGDEDGDGSVCRGGQVERR